IGVSPRANEGSVSTRGTDGQALAEFAGRMCYDAETEILTSVGWMRSSNLTGSEMVATLNQTTGATEFQPHKVWRYEYSGDMLSIDHEHVSLLVTPEHRMYVQLKGGDFEIVEARDGVNLAYLFRIAGWQFDGERRLAVIVAGVILTHTAL